MGKVRETASNKYYARKRIYLDSIISCKEIEDLVTNEIKSTQQLHHRHISTIDFWINEDNAYSLFMQPVADCDLRSYLSLCTRQAFPKAMTSSMYPWFGCLINALAYIHEMKMRHGDIKPSNILVKDGQPYLTDFGLARVMSQVNMSQSSDHGIPGTRLYHAPEVRPDQSYDHSSDVFALGCVYSEMFTITHQKSLEEYHGFIRHGFIRQGAESIHYRDCLPRVEEWLLQLFDSGGSDFLLEEQILRMMKENPERRITAGIAFRLLGRHERFRCDECRKDSVRRELLRAP